MSDVARSREACRRIQSSKVGSEILDTYLGTYGGVQMGGQITRNSALRCPSMPPRDLLESSHERRYCLQRTDAGTLAAHRTPVGASH